MAGFIKFNWYDTKILSLVSAASDKGTLEAANRILDLAQRHVPLDEGVLMGTGKVSSDGNKAAVSYGTAYAAKLHQHPEYNFRGQGRGRWLQDAVEEHEGVLEAMGNPLKVVL